MITKGFEFKVDDREFIVITDYEKFDENMKFVQIANKETPNKSAGQIDKETIKKLINKQK